MMIYVVVRTEAVIATAVVYLFRYVRRRKRKAVGIPYTGKTVTEIECDFRPNLGNVIVLDIRFILYYQQRTGAEDLMYSHECFYQVNATRRIMGTYR